MVTATLRARAKQFIARPIPEELKPHYAPGSLADMVVAQIAEGELIDGELAEVAEMAAVAYDDAIAGAATAELKDYYRECQAILQEVTASA